MNNRKIIRIWLRFLPECLKFIETLTKHLNEETREQIFQLLADYWRLGCYPKDNHRVMGSPEAKNIAAHLIYYTEFIEGQRIELPKHEHIPITSRYLRCFDITQRKCRKRKSDPLTIPEEYSFLGEIVEQYSSLLARKCEKASVILSSIIMYKCLIYSFDFFLDGTNIPNKVFLFFWMKS